MILRIRQAVEIMKKSNYKGERTLETQALQKGLPSKRIENLLYSIRNAG
jgi:hypothetical protein